MITPLYRLMEYPYSQVKVDEMEEKKDYRGCIFSNAYGGGKIFGGPATANLPWLYTFDIIHSQGFEESEVRLTKEPYVQYR